MRFRTENRGADVSVAVRHADRWVPLTEAAAAVGSDLRTLLGVAGDDLTAVLAGGERFRTRIDELCAQVEGTAFAPGLPTLPFQPLSLRCFSLWQAHWEQAARVMATRYHPLGKPVGRFIRAYEALTRSTFPPLRPGKEFFDHPTYYTGNHLNVFADGEPVVWPSYCRDLDYELEIGALVVQPLRDATEAQAEAAIGGFVVFNDLSARDTQWQEYSQGSFGPVVKTKTFGNAIGAEVVTPDEVLPYLTGPDGLTGSVTVNGETWARTSTRGMRYSVGEMVARASLGEQVYPGELMLTGTLPNGSGMELNRWLSPGDKLTLEIERIGSVSSIIGDRPSRATR